MSFVTIAELADSDASFYGRRSPAPSRAGSLGDTSSSLGAVVEYIRPVAALKEGSFESTAAMEAGGDDMADDGMGEQMLYEGLTGTDADKIASPGLVDSVDAGGQAVFTEVSSSDQGDWEHDDGQAGNDVLVEPGQTPPAEQPRPQSRSQNTSVVPAEPPVFRPANGASPQNGRNGASHQNGVSRQNGAQNGAHRNGFAPRNRITAYSDAAPLIQGTGAATAARRQTVDIGAPPMPETFGLGADQSVVDFVTNITKAAGQVGTAVVTSQMGPPPQFLPGQQPNQVMDPALLAKLTGQQPQQQPTTNVLPQQKSSVMPWVVGAIGVGAVAAGIWWFTRKKGSSTTSVASVPASAEPVAAKAANPARRRKKSSKALTLCTECGEGWNQHRPCACPVKKAGKKAVKGRGKRKKAWRQ